LRALRLERLAEGHPLAEYLRLIAGLCHAQQRLMDDPPDAAVPDPQRVQRCLEHGLPPFAADSLVREDAWLPWLHGLLQGYQPAAQSAVEQAVRHCATPAPGSSRSGRWRWSAVSSLLPAALVPFLGAALQAAWSHWLLTTPDPP
jgi:FdhE protein